MVRLLTLFSPVRAAASVGQTSAPSVILGKRTAITNALWEGETEDAEESEPAFGQIEIPIFGMKTYTDISVQLLEDAAQNVETELTTALAEDFGRKEGIAFLNGTGVKQPRGIMVHPNVASVPNGHATQLQLNGLIDLFHSLAPAYRNNGVWMLNSTAIAAIRKMTSSMGAPIWVDSLAVGNPATILGRPVVEAVDMPDVANGTSPILFGDFRSAYRIYDRVSLAVLRDPYSMAKNSLVRFHARRRVGGDVIRPEAIKKLKMIAA
jgi:HK97 family phage major capsid protein